MALNFSNTDTAIDDIGVIWSHIIREINQESRMAIRQRNARMDSENAGFIDGNSSAREGAHCCERHIRMYFRGHLAE
jgi:hypothetical protein